MVWTIADCVEFSQLILIVVKKVEFRWVKASVSNSKARGCFTSAASSPIPLFVFDQWKSLHSILYRTELCKTTQWCMWDRYVQIFAPILILAYVLDLTSPVEEFEQQLCEWIGWRPTMHRPYIQPIRRLVPQAILLSYYLWVNPAFLSLC